MSQNLEDPNNSLQAPDIELEAASARHGIWGRLQVRFGRAEETEDHGYQGGGAASSSSTTTGLQRGPETAKDEGPPVKSPPVLPKYAQGVSGPLPKPPPVLPKYVQHVAETIEGLKSGYYPRKCPPAELMGDSGGKAAARGAAAMGTIHPKVRLRTRGRRCLSDRLDWDRRLGSAWPEEYPPWVTAPKPGPLPHPSEGTQDDPHKAYPSRWDRPHWPSVARLVPPVGDDEETLVIQPSIWWTQKFFDKVQCLMDEEATHEISANSKDRLLGLFTPAAGNLDGSKAQLEGATISPRASIDS